MLQLLFILLLSFFSSSDYEHKLLLREVNMVRTSGCNCGDTYFHPVKKLKWSNDLAALAKLHAQDMQNGTYFSHYNEQGEDVSDRAGQIYYRWTMIGENIAISQKSDLEVMRAWLASEEHCKMIMEPDIIEIGCARVGHYWVQNFSRSSSITQSMFTEYQTYSQKKD